MAALDPKYEFTFSLGPPTVGNLNTAAGAPLLTVAAVHYLQVASGGTLPAAPGAPNRFVVPWPDIDVAMLKVHTLDAAVHGTQCAARITNLRATASQTCRELLHASELRSCEVSTYCLAQA